MGSKIILNEKLEIIDTDTLQQQIQDKNIIIWGASRGNNDIVQYLNKNNCKFIMDCNKNIIGKVQFDKEIIAPKECNGEIILSCVKNIQGLLGHWKSLGYTKWFYFFDANNYSANFQKFIEKFSIYNKKIVFDGNNVKYLHIIPDQKFFSQVYNIINNYYKIAEHAFLVYDMNHSNPNDIYNTWDKYIYLYNKYNNITILDDVYNLLNLDINSIIMELDIALDNSSRIIFHGEWVTPYIEALFLDKTDYLENKGVFLPWSGNVGNVDVTNKYLKSIIRHCHYVAINDIALFGFLVKKFRWINAVQLDIVNPYACSIEKFKKKKNLIPKILIGNSCYSHNCVADGLKCLEKFKDQIDIYIISSYGESKIIDETNETGYNIYGNKFHSINLFMEYQDYADFLGQIDVYISLSEKGGGNNTIKLLLSHGAKIIMNPRSRAYSYYINIGLKIYDTNNLKNLSLEELVINPYSEENKKLSIQEFEKESIISTWNKVLNIM